MFAHNKTWEHKTVLIRSFVSGIIPAFSSVRSIGDALVSVFEQDYYPLKLIVVDNGASDNTLEIGRSFKDIVYAFQLNRGLLPLAIAA